MTTHDHILIASRRVIATSARRLSALAILISALGCSAVMHVGMEIVTDPVPPAPRAFEDLAYREGDGADPLKHRLDLFLPPEEVRGFPMLVFVHGGGFDSGDKDFTVGGVEVYANIGRFYAGRGIGVAVISYRLQPAVTWAEQLDDVARAVAFVVREAPGYGAGRALVLAGHSAGAWLVARLAVDDAMLGHHDLDHARIAGVVAVSGAGFDLEDEATWSMDADLAWSEAHFRLRQGDTDWQHSASVLPLIGDRPPPFLLLHTHDEWKSVARQNQLLRRALRQAGGEVTLVTIDGGSHARMVLRLARADTIDSGLVEDFVKNQAARQAGEHQAGLGYWGEMPRGNEVSDSAPSSVTSMSSSMRTPPTPPR